jgi:hypothetical protein
VNRHGESQEDSRALRNRATQFEREASLHPHSSAHADSILGGLPRDPFVDAGHRFRDVFARRRIYNESRETFAGA